MVAATVEVPSRSVQQRREALTRANRIRTHRARVKRDIKAGRAKVTPLVADPEPMLASMRVMDLLIAVPHWGRVKVNKVLAKSRTSPSKTLEGLSDRQRREIVYLLGGR